jgi:hypothetical protein
MAASETAQAFGWMLPTELQELWEASLQRRARIATQSLVGVLDTLLASWREPTNKIGSQSAPKIGHRITGRPGHRSGRAF